MRRTLASALASVALLLSSAAPAQASGRLVETGATARHIKIALTAYRNSMHVCEAGVGCGYSYARLKFGGGSWLVRNQRITFRVVATNVHGKVVSRRTLSYKPLRKAAGWHGVEYPRSLGVTFVTYYVDVTGDGRTEHPYGVPVTASGW